MKKSKKIAKLSVQELEKRIAPASASAFAHSQGAAHASSNGIANASENSVIHPRCEDRNCGGVENIGGR